MENPKNIFNFGTGDIDKDQWLRDIDSELEDFISKYGMATNKHRTALLRQAFQDLRTRIANGDMLNRTADGRYQFGSMLNRDDKHMQEAYERALGFMGGLARRQIQTPAEPEKKTIGSLEERFIKYLNPSGKLNSEAYWKNQTDEERKSSLLQFLNKELGEVDKYQDFGGFETAQAYRDRLNNVLGLFNSGKINDNSLQLLGFTRNWITLPTSEELEEKSTKSELELLEESLNLQIDLFTRTQALKEKLQQLAWAQDADTFKGETFELQNFLPYDFEIDSRPYKTDLELYNFYNRSYNALDKYFGSLATNWRTIYSGGQATRGMLNHNLAKLFSSFDNLGKTNYHFADLINKYFTPVQGGFLLNGTNEENGRNVYYVPGKRFTVTAHNKPWAVISSLKEGGVLKYLVGGGFDTYMAYRLALLTPKLETKLLQETELKSRNPFDSWTTGDYALLGSAAADVASAAVSYVPGGQFASGILGAGSTLTSSIVDFKRDNVKSGLANLVLGLGADVAGMLPVVGTAAKTAKIAKTIGKLSKVLVPTFTAMGAYQALGATRKLITGESLTPLEWQDLAQGIQLIFSGGAKGVAGHSNSAFKRTQAEGVTHYDVKLEDGTISRISREEFEGAKRNDYKGTAKQNIFGQIKGKSVVTKEGIQKANKLIVSESLNPLNSITRRLKYYMYGKAGDQGYYIKNWIWPEWSPIQNRLKKILERRLGLTLPVPPKGNLPKADMPVTLLGVIKDEKKHKPLTEELKLKRREAAALRKLKKLEAAAKLLALKQLQELTRSRAAMLTDIPTPEMSHYSTVAEAQRKLLESLRLNSRWSLEEIPDNLPLRHKVGGILKTLRNGGILKADAGLLFPDLKPELNFNSQYYQSWVNLNWNNPENFQATLKGYKPGGSSYRISNGLPAKGGEPKKRYENSQGEQDFMSAYQEQQEYYNKDAGSHIFGDVLNYYNLYWLPSNQGRTYEDFIKDYNSNVDKLRQDASRKLTGVANLDKTWGEYNTLFNLMYANYSPFSENLKDTLGESTWRRTPNTFNGINDRENLRYGLLNPKDPKSKVILDNKGHLIIPDVLAGPEGDSSANKAQSKKEGAADSATERRTIPVPEYKNPFDPSLLISAAKYFAGLRGNRDIYQNLLDEMPEAPLRDPLDRKLAIVGWLERIKSGQNQLADLRRIQLMQQGSDQLANFATALDTERTGRDIMDRAFAEDSGRQFETALKSWNLDNEDILYNTGVGDANRKSIADRQRMMAQIRAAWRSGDQNLKMGLLADTGNWFMKRYQREQDMIDRAKELSLGTPEEWAQSEYTSRLGELANKKASDLTEAERAKADAIRAQVMREMRLKYSENYYNLYHTPGFGGGFGYALMSKNGSKLEVAKLKARSKDNDRYVSMIKDLRKRRRR